MTLYLDTTCWYRPFENHTNQSRINEQEAILSILEENESDRDGFQIVSCEMQVNQVYSKRNSSNTSSDEKKVLNSIIDSIETHTGDTTNRNPPFVSQYLNSFLQSTNLRDREDAKHILTAWILKADYFLTTDYSSILNINDNHQIENFLDSQIHPILGTRENNVQIHDPVTGLTKILDI